jgi:hypothetical protein
MDVLGPLLAPERLVTRVVSDIRRSLARMETLQRQTLAATEAWLSMTAQLRDQLDLLDRRSQSIGDIVDKLGPTLDKLGPALDALVRIEPIAAGVLATAREIEPHAEQVHLRAAEIVDFLPTIARAVELIEPLEGTVERLGRVVDRLPGGRTRTFRDAQ